MIFGIKIDNFDPYNVLLAIATNIPVLLMTAFVLQGHISTYSTNPNLTVYNTLTIANWHVVTY